MFKSIGSETVMHQHFQAAYDYASVAARRGVDGERLISLVLGPPRSGKTDICNMLVQDLKPAPQEGARSVPVIRVVTPVRPTKKTMAEAIVGALDTRTFGRQTADQLTARAKFLLNAVGTRVILFDEVQHIVERNSAKSWYEVADWLKTLSDDLNLTLILFGLPSARQIIEVNNQLRDRSDSPYLLYPYNWNRQEDVTEFCRCLLAARQYLGDLGWSVPDFTDLGLVRRFYASSSGRYGMVVKLLDTSMHVARRSKIMSLNVFHEAHRLSIYSQPDVPNPFDPKIQPAERLTDSLLVRYYADLLNESDMRVLPVGQKKLFFDETAPPRSAGTSV
ncbi:TniB family NTP-binding protein [Cycloclasticus pugetii]|uniref:TniB family NTP-binding protein n=1 Tax=Cycloclasticus pugetii TaxID=34068 RepID=UPI003A921EE1